MRAMKKIIVALLALALCLSLFACAKPEQSSEPEQPAQSSGSEQSEQPTEPAQPEQSAEPSAPEVSSEPLNVGILVSTVGIPALYAQEKGWFEEAGLNVNLIIFATGAPVNEAIAAEELDVACSGFASVYSLANANCTWLLDINSTGGMGVYARPDSPVVAAGNTVSDLPKMLGSAETVKGLQILGPVGTAVQYMTEGYAEKLGLANDEVNMVNMEYAAAYQAFTTGEGDLAAMNPPTSYTLEDEGYIQVASFEDSTGVSLCDGCFARNAICESRPADIQAFVKVLIRAMDELQDYDTRFEFSMRKFTENGTTYTDDILNREIEDRAYYGTELTTASDYVFGEAWGAITDFLVRAEKISAENAPNVASSLDPSYLSSAVGADITAYEGE